MNEDESRYYRDVEHWQQPTQCPDCGAAVYNESQHDAWHDKVDGSEETP